MEAREKADDSSLGGLWISNEKRLTDAKREMQLIESRFIAFIYRPEILKDENANKQIEGQFGEN